ncbi:PRC-barrel domain-containing protein [Rhodanobacter sp. AS-Z3]|uniref:PRC-barrel domain-containing protein n=1 Tax=Rhodanobacter sp. AS-Z3 TaxID=3031330 RepID=UPI0024799C66|nr:PRC-barrel domain-containing protein [Rhodanobacter sp. AS-Z3]WEN16509.1 PRC-barrel domain-containing protein [Rhodanobacter sp. AS-Z3]
MLRSSKDLEHYAIHATDGLIGHVRDFYFDDKAWVVRFLVVDTGSWLHGREVLISPISLGHCDYVKQLLPVSLTKAQVKGSPDIDTHQPISRQHEMGYLSYYGYPYYWGGHGLWGAGSFPSLMLTSVDDPDGRGVLPHASPMHEAGSAPGDDPHLRSINAMNNYCIEATDGEIGHVRGFLVEEGTWAIRYLVVETSHWWLGHQVLIVPEWIRAVSWLDRSVNVVVTRHQISTAPAYDAALLLERKDEEALFKHYGSPGYRGLPF